MKNYLTFALALLFFLMAQSSYAQDFKPEVKIGGVIFTGWTYNADNSDFITKLDTSAAGLNPGAAFGHNPTKNQFETGKNSFTIDRAYINVKASLTPQISARITPDIFSFTDGAGATQYGFQLKYALMDYTPISLENGTNLMFEAGVIPNQWISGIERYYGYRGVAKTLTDYSYTLSATRSTNTVKRTMGSYFSSADIGLTAKFTFPNKIADLYLSILNGNGYKNEGFDNRFKDFMATAFIYPLQGMIKSKMDAAKKNKKTRIDGIADLTFGGFMYLGKLSSGEYGVADGGQYKNNRFGGMLNLKFNFEKFGYLKVGGEFSLQSNAVPSPNADSSITARGISVFLDFNPPIESLNEKLSITFRYDNFDPNTNKPGYNASGLNSDNGKQSLMIFGLMYKPANILTLGLSYHILGFEKNFVTDYSGTTSSSISRLYFNTIVDF
jgi:hypothetical protein